MAEEQQAPDQFDTWRKLRELRKANPIKAAFRAAVTAAGIHVHEDIPISGYYRRSRHKDGPLEPVGIWRDADDNLFIEWRGILWGTEEGRVERAIEEVWPWCVWDPVEFEAYSAKLEGRDWPDTPPAGWRDDEEAPPRGHNMPPEAGTEEADAGSATAGRAGAAAADPASEPTEVERARAELDRLKQAAQQFKDIGSDQTRDQSQVTRSDLTALAGRLDRRREALVRPHIDAQRAINGEWMPLVNEAKTAAGGIKTAQDAWANTKLQERIAAETAQRHAAEEAQRQADDARAAEYELAAEEGRDPAPPQQPLPTQSPPTAPAAPTTTAFRGARGRSSRELAVDELFIVDQDAVYQHFRANDRVKALLLDLAARIFNDTGEMVPGTDSKKVGKVA